MSLTGSALTLAVCELQESKSAALPAILGLGLGRILILIHWSHGRGYGAFRLQNDKIKLPLLKHNMHTGFREGMRESEAGRGRAGLGAFGYGHMELHRFDVPCFLLHIKYCHH